MTILLTALAFPGAEGERAGALTFSARKSTKEALASMEPRENDAISLSVALSPPVSLPLVFSFSSSLPSLVLSPSRSFPSFLSLSLSLSFSLSLTLHPLFAHFIPPNRGFTFAVAAATLESGSLARTSSTSRTVASCLDRRCWYPSGVFGGSSLSARAFRHSGARIRPSEGCRGCPGWERRERASPSFRDRSSMDRPMRDAKETSECVVRMRAAMCTQLIRVPWAKARTRRSNSTGIPHVTSRAHCAWNATIAMRSRNDAAWTGSLARCRMLDLREWPRQWSRVYLRWETPFGVKCEPWTCHWCRLCDFFDLTLHRAWESNIDSRSFE